MASPKPLLIVYDQTPNVHFFLCRSCRTHIALVQEFVFRDPMANVGILENAVNVRVDGPSNYKMDGENTVADVYCKSCRCLLGERFVEVPRENIIIKQGRFLLHLEKLLMWEGTQMLYAHTNEPVENP